MCYLRFDKSQMTNLQDSLYKEMLITNRSGAYCSTTLVGCNIRKYDGLLVIPVPELDDENHVLLSSLDETVIQHGAEFNLGLHKYQGDNYSPKGHKYIVSFEWEQVPTWTYRVGGVLLKKEILFDTSIHRIYIRYTLLDAHSATTLRLRPFLAFRSVRQWTHENGTANSSYDEVSNGIRMCLYQGYPDLYMQTSKKAAWNYCPDWYRGLEYPKERERGYESTEDLLTPGYFEMPIKKGESIIFSAGIAPIKPKEISVLLEKERESLDHRDSFYHCLVNAAHQFRVTKDGENYLLAGYPWFKPRARDTFISMPGLTLAIGEKERFEMYMATASKAIYNLIRKEPLEVDIYEMEQPDTLLWAIWCIQQYAKYTSRTACYEKYGVLLRDIIEYVRSGKHPNLFIHENGLVYANGRDHAITWMNSQCGGRPIVPRSGYIVEFNALWYNALKFFEQILTENPGAGHAEVAEETGKEAEKLAKSFKDVFLNEYGYLLDYVDGQMMDWSVRPNQLFAIALDFSPLDMKERKSVLDICTKELVTPKGIRSLSPKSGGYNPMYVGQQTQRDFAYHQGTAWPWLTGFYLEAYLRVYRMSGVNYIERQLIGFEEELFYHCVGTIPELFDGNPPFHGRGAISFAMNVSGILRALQQLEKYNSTF
ncbi:MAG: amylo-alpha-1,6-glucosidase [Bacteroidales bacterium]|nr:amylo-alpha-1,6-glucosidase [Bacteroidales bacterium]MDD6076462.1 amylo-alpha-1,6-glucosidase [Bacteroidales bacterium]MDD6554870.1 amylo-alpha-1,6-glucosidase [Bacteroidales bacterium]MDD6775613.1 amylo-alpha-1,6-glucosidase [Bacteroidales bacterium]